MHKWNPLNTSVAEIHYLISEDAAWIANQLIYEDRYIPKKWKGYVFMNASPYSQDGLTIEVAGGYQGAPARVKSRYQKHGKLAIQQAIVKNKNEFVGLILGEAKAGRNYFMRWDQAPTQLF